MLKLSNNNYKYDIRQDAQHFIFSPLVDQVVWGLFLFKQKVFHWTKHLTTKQLAIASKQYCGERDISLH